MKTVQRTTGIRRVIRNTILGKPARKYVTAGNDACGRMMCEARRRRNPGPSDSAILAWAKYDLECEFLGGYWQRTAA